jgi:GrpB-like predicted nucleotidyltransferase (UPF0157 family)
MSHYDFLPYDQKFPELFDKEEKRLRTFLGTEPIIEHFGSTAVPRLGGKGIIDIYVVVPKEYLKSISEKLQKEAGYEYRADVGEEKERLFHRRTALDENGIQRTYHLHLIHPDFMELKEAIAFRNYLRTHPGETEKYAEIKKRAADEANKIGDGKLAKEKYLEIKGDIIKEITKKALTREIT